MTARLHIRGLVVLLALVPAFYSCTMAMFSPPVCYDSLDCPPNMKCDVQTHQCVPMSLPTSVVDFELTPPMGSGAANTQIPAQDLANLVNVTDVILEADPEIPLVGRVMPPENPGTLVVSRIPEIDNRRLTWNIDVTESGYFDAKLTHGKCDLLFKPSSRDKWPQLQLCEFEVPAEPSRMPAAPLMFPTYPAEDDLHAQEHVLLVKGRVLQSQSYPHPVTGIVVEGITEAQLRTSLAVPDEQGYFFLRLPVLSRTLGEDGTSVEYTYPERLDVTLRPEVAESRLPTVTVPGVPLDYPELGTFYLGEIPASFSASGMVTDSSGTPLGSCQVRFQADIGNGTFSHQILTDEAGSFSTTLPGGSYRVMVVPSLVSTSRILSTTLELKGDKTDVLLVLRNRPSLSSTIRDSDRNQVADVIVRAERLSTYSGVDDGVQRTYEGISDAAGSFSLAVDSGRYRVTFIPPAASGLPRRSIPVYVIEEDQILDSSLTTLPLPAVITGHVTGGDGKPLCRVTIDVFRSDETSAYRIGQAISSEEVDSGCTGSYAVIIPGDILGPGGDGN